MSLHYNRALIDRAKELRKNVTQHERKLWRVFLSSYPVRFQRQKVIDNYIVDFYCAKAKLVIELDGGGHYEPDQMEYDKIRTELLNAYGLTVLRFSNLEIEQNFDSVCWEIEQMVKVPPSGQGGGA